MRVGVGVGVGYLRGGLGAGVSGGTAPTITGTPLLTDDEISISGTLPITLYGKNSATSTPLSTAAIEAAPDDTEVLAGGTNYLPALNLETTPGTWYYNYFAKNGAGSSAVETESYVVAAPMEVTSQNSNNGFGGSFSAAIGATSAGDSILIFVGLQGVAQTVSATDFTIKAEYSTNTNRVTILEWNGGGTRPNSSNVTVTLSGSENYCYQSLVIPQAAVTNGTNGATATAATHTLPTVATTARSITVAACIASTDAITPTGPGTPPALAPGLPSEDGYWVVDRAGNFRLTVFAYSTPTPGTSTAIEMSTPGSTNVRYALVAVED